MKKRVSKSEKGKRGPKVAADLPVAKRKSTEVRGGMAALPIDDYASTNYLSA